MEGEWALSGGWRTGGCLSDCEERKKKSKMSLIIGNGTIQVMAMLNGE